MTTTTQHSLIQALQNPTLYPHEVKYLKVIETHISWVIITGSYAYKIKKALDFVFLDFSTLEKRRHFCHEELRLNRPLAPSIYDSVIPIHDNNGLPNFQGKGPIVEYALRMHEFPQENLFIHLLKHNQLTPTLIAKTACVLAAFHAKTSRAIPNSYLGSPEQVQEPVIQNFDQIRPLLTNPNDLAQLARLAHWSNQHYLDRYALLQARKANGFIRECHGDVHLGNIVLLDGQPVLFDCIEFNEPFRWTDTMADLGFLAMDLEDQERAADAKLLINSYLEQSGDYEGLAVLRYYQAYRAIVRAKVTLFRLQQPGLSAEEQHETLTRYRRNMTLAEHYAETKTPSLTITYGLSGSGKSTFAKEAADRTGAICVRSDIERKRIFGLSPLDQSHSGINQQLYSPTATQKTYEHLLRTAEIILAAGYSVVIDAAFLKEAQRTRFRLLAEQLQVPFTIIACEAPLELLRARIQSRRHATVPLDPSEATLDVLAMQNSIAEPLTDHEMHVAIVYQT